MLVTRTLRVAVVAAALLPTLPASAAVTAEPPAPESALASTITAAATGLRAEVLAEALAATACAARDGRVTDTTHLTVIDYSLPSTERRLWVVDTRTGAVLFHELVAHGKHSGENLTTRFSNAPDSLQTSLGLFVTADTYVGQNGYSLRLDGLEPGVNDRARERAIVMHGAPYVDAALARKTGRLGRSWGCPAVSLAVARRLIDTIKGGSPVFAYYPRTARVAAGPACPLPGTAAGAGQP